MDLNMNKKQKLNTKVAFNKDSKAGVKQGVERPVKTAERSRKHRVESDKDHINSRLKLRVTLSALGERPLGVDVMSRNGRVVVVASPKVPGDAQLLPGDIVRRVNGERISSDEDFTQAVERVRLMGVKLKLTIRRQFNQDLVKTTDVTDLLESMLNEPPGPSVGENFVKPLLSLDYAAYCNPVHELEMGNPLAIKDFCPRRRDVCQIIKNKLNQILKDFAGYISAENETAKNLTTNEALVSQTETDNDSVSSTSGRNLLDGLKQEANPTDKILTRSQPVAKVKNEEQGRWETEIAADEDESSSDDEDHDDTLYDHRGQMLSQIQQIFDFNAPLPPHRETIGQQRQRTKTVVNHRSTVQSKAPIATGSNSKSSVDARSGGGRSVLLLDSSSSTCRVNIVSDIPQGRCLRRPKHGRTTL